MTLSARAGMRRALAIAATGLLAHAPIAWSQAAINCSTELYGVTQNGSLFRVNITTGAASAVGATPVNLTEIEFDAASGQLWAADGPGHGGPSMLRLLNPASGAELSAVAFNPAGFVTGMEIVGNTFYGAYSNGAGSPSMLVTIDRTTGTLTTIGAMGISVPIAGLAHDTTTSTMYGVTAGGQGIAALMRIDLTTGVATFVGPIGSYTKIGSIEFGPDGNLYGGVSQDGMLDPGWLLRINPATGAPTRIGDMSFSTTGLAACPAAAPPPPPPPPPPAPSVAVPTLSSFGFIGLGALIAIAGFAALRRRSR